MVAVRTIRSAWQLWQGVNRSRWLVHSALKSGSAAQQTAVNVHSSYTDGSRPQQGQPSGLLMQRYEALLAGGVLRPDAGQAACLAQLAELADRLAVYSQAVDEYQPLLLAYQAERERQRQALKRVEAEATAAQQRQGTPGAGQEGVLAWLRQRLGAESTRPAGQLTDREAALQAATSREAQLNLLVGPPPRAPPTPQGLYIYGSVGSGKSLLMDMFYSVVSELNATPLRRRMHFNAAMLEVHSRLHRLERERMERDSAALDQYAQFHALQELGASQPADAAQGPQDPVSLTQRDTKRARLAARRLLSLRRGKSAEQYSEALARSNAWPLRAVAHSLIRAQDGDMAAGWGVGGTRRAALLCFDEVQVTDPFTAVALKGIMEALLAEGAVIIATSNRPPWELPRHGLHEDLFNHFVGQLLTSCKPVELSSALDYRRVAANSPSQVADPSSQDINSYYHPLSPETGAGFDQHWQRLVAAEGCEAEAPRKLPVMFGRTLTVPRTAGGVARFRFEELCAARLGAADYMALAQAFHTLLLEGVPEMSMQVRDQARRFITLVDELYNHRARLVCWAACAPDELFAGAHGAEEPLVDLESLQFEGAVEGSRLRRNLMADGGVAPLGATADKAAAIQQSLGGLEEQFAFKRAVSRLHEMQSPAYRAARQPGRAVAL